jgi:hypothetical protein
VSTTAIATVRERYPNSAVEYAVTNLLDPPARWQRAFDLVVESLTVQSLPIPVHRQAIIHIGQFVAPGGTLVVHSAARDADGVPEEGPPWRLTRAEVSSFATGELHLVRLEDVSYLGVGRWRAEFHRPAVPEGGA